MAIAPQTPAMLPVDAVFHEPTMPEEPTTSPEMNAEAALVGVLEEKRLKAQALSEKIKRKWAQYVIMRFHAGLKDDPDHPLTELGLYIASLAKYAATMKANIVKKVLPNPADMDFFALKSKALGIEPVAERWEAYCREKFKIMVPSNADGFTEQIDNEADDWIFLGNAVSLVKHQYYEGDVVGDNVLHGPVEERLDPFNCWPDTITVDTAAQANWFVYDPISREELEDPDNGYVNVETVIADETEAERPSRDPATRGDGADTDNDTPSEWEHDDDSYERWMYFGRFPKHAVIRMLRGDEEVAAEVDYPAVLAELAATFGFDPMMAEEREWWWVEFIGKTVIKCEPWPYWLPQGFGPIDLSVLFKRNGFLWGHGLWDYAAVEERILNSHHRDLVTLSRLAARRPKEYDKNRVDPEFLAERGEQLTLEPDDSVPVLGQDGKPVIRFFDIDVNAIKLLTEEMKRLENNMRELTGVTSAVEGNDKSGTATQAANNMGQSMVLIERLAAMFEAFMRRKVQRALAICMQAIRETGMAEYVQAPYDEMQLQMLDITPEHVIGMSFLDVQMQGTSSPGNQIHQAQALTEWFKLFLPTGGLNIFESIKRSAQVFGIKGYEQLLAIQDRDDPMRMAYNLMAAFGPKGLQFLPPAAMAAVMSAVTGINPMMLMPPAPAPVEGGPGGQPGGGGQPPQAGGGMPQMPMNPMPGGMGAGSGMSGGMGSMPPGM